MIGGLLAVLRIVERKGFPFGPFMLLGAVVGLLWGDGFWSGRRGSPPRYRSCPWKTDRMLRWLTAGESHGPALVAILEGLPHTCR